MAVERLRENQDYRRFISLL